MLRSRASTRSSPKNEKTERIIYFGTDKRERRKHRVQSIKGKRILSLIAISMALVPFLLVMIILYLPNINHDDTTNTYHDSRTVSTSKYLRKDVKIENTEKNPVGLDANSEHSKKEGKIIIMGMIQDASKINDFIWFFLIQMNCQYNAHIHILAHQGTRQAMRIRDSRQLQYDNKCASFELLKEQADAIFGENKSKLSNRIDRISQLRNYQRDVLSHQYSDEDNDDVIIVVDLDLWKLPQVREIIKLAKQLQDSNYPHDALCAAGVTMASKDELWYYDLFATVLLPDTFIYPLSRRLIPKHYQGEDLRYVRSNSAHGSVTQGDLMTHFWDQAKASDTGAFRMKSCFGGLTLYRSSAYFQPQCNYELPSQELAMANKNNDNHELTLMRYAGAKDKRPCEHVVFHDCLHQLESPIDLALHPKLITLWKRN